MGALRIFFRQHRVLAFALVMLALALKAVVPTGFMIEAGARTVTVLVCHDASGGTGTRQIALPARSGQNDALGKVANETCPYAGLSMASLGGADPVVLALALAFIVALGFRPIAVRHAGPVSYLRPPLRGPPVTA